MSSLKSLRINFLVLYLLYSSVSALDSGSPTQFSLWGKMADFTKGCSHWRLRSEVLIPALKEFTVCLHVQLKVDTSAPWTAFMYRGAAGQWAELGLGGRSGRLVVWLLGVEWITRDMMQLTAHRWHYLCLTWSQTTGSPTLYVDGDVVVLTAVTPLTSSSRLRLAPNGSLTLGASHFLSNSQLQILPISRLRGWLSLFRLWGRARTIQEVTSQGCTEGDLVKWGEEHWAAPTCTSTPESFLPCEWSVYEIRLRFAIIRYDGSITDLYSARDLAHYWLGEVLASTIYIHRVSVSELARPFEDGFERNIHSVWWGNVNIDRFCCLAHLNVIPSQDVSVVQKDINRLLLPAYREPMGLLQLMADPTSICTSPIDSFPSGTLSPTVSVTNSSATTPATSSNAMTSLPVLTPSTTATLSSPVATNSTINTSTSSSTSTISVTTLNTLTEFYFEVQVNVSLTGDYHPETFLLCWLNSRLPSEEMTVLNFQVLSKTDRLHSDLHANASTEVVMSPRHSRESCVFQVRVMTSPSATSETEERIRHLLELPYNSSSVTMETQDIHVSRILIVECEQHTHQTRKGLFRWPTTRAQNNATLPCPGDPHRNATRHCTLCLSTYWIEPDLDQCPLVVETIQDLDHIDVTPENSVDVVALIESLLRDHSTLSYQELRTLLNKLRAALKASVVTQSLGRSAVAILSDILQSDSDLAPFTNTILNITETVGDRVLSSGGPSTSLVAWTVALSVVDVSPGDFRNLTFAVSSEQGGFNPEIHINETPFNSTVAVISLPSALNHSFPHDNTPRIQFQFYGSPLLFKQPESAECGFKLNSFVVAASVTNASRSIKDLDQDVAITLLHLVPTTLNKNVHCVYWDFDKNRGLGGWDSQGCRMHSSSVDYTTCLCDHLTHFGVLLDVTRTEIDPTTAKLLTMVTYVGCGVSSIFLGVTVLTYTAFENLRRDYPSQILINLSLALMALNLVFLLNSWLSSWGVYGLCVGVASALHYFLLASFTWMGLEAVNMYLALVKVFNIYVPSYILKFCLLGWGIPLVVCLLVLVVNREAYGRNMKTQNNNDDFCWIQDDVTFYVSVVGYAAMVFLFNIAVFVVVLIQIHRMRVNRPAGIRSGLLQDLKGVASLTLLLGLTWTTGFFTWGPARVPLLYLFSGLNSLQGLLIFLFHCLMKENVRQQWLHLCFECFRIEEYTVEPHGVAVRSSPGHLAPLAPSVGSVKSSATDSTSASSDSGQGDPSVRRPHLALLVNALTLPRARCIAPSTDKHSAFPADQETNLS